MGLYAIASKFKVAFLDWMAIKFEVVVHVGVMASKFEVGMCWCDGEQVRNWSVCVMTGKFEVAVLV